jgi:hypothetical protein
MQNSCLNFPEALQITELGLLAAGIFSAPSEAPQRFPNIVVLEHIFNPTFLGRPLVFPWVKILSSFA